MKNSDYHIYRNKHPQVFPQTATFGVRGAEYIEIEGNHQILANYEGENNVLLTDETGSVTYEIEVSEAGFYRVLVTYYPFMGDDNNDIQGKSSNIERRIYIDGEVPFESADNVLFRRLWGGEKEVEKIFTVTILIKTNRIT